MTAFPRRRVLLVGTLLTVALIVYLMLKPRPHVTAESAEAPQTSEDAVTIESSVTGRATELDSEPARVIGAALPAPSAAAETAPAAFAPVCPSARPADGSACEPGSVLLRCGYDELPAPVVCECEAPAAGGTSKWKCSTESTQATPPPCPEAPQATGERCSAVNQLCRYGSGYDLVMCRCESDGWDCRSFSEWQNSK